MDTASLPPFPPLFILLHCKDCCYSPSVPSSFSFLIHILGRSSRSSMSTPQPFKNLEIPWIKQKTWIVCEINLYFGIIKRGALQRVFDGCEKEQSSWIIIALCDWMVTPQVHRVLLLIPSHIHTQVLLDHTGCQPGRGEPQHSDNKASHDPGHVEWVTQILEGPGEKNPEGMGKGYKMEAKHLK